MEIKVINSLMSQIDRLNQKWSRALSREMAGSGSEVRKKLIEATYDHFEQVFRMLKGRNMEQASEYGEEVAHRANGLNLQLAHLIQAYQTGKRLVLEQVFKAIPDKGQVLLKTIREIEKVYAAFEIAAARSHWNFEQGRVSEDAVKTFQQDEELKVLRHRMSEVERAGKTLSNFGIQLMLLDNQRRVLWGNRAAREQFQEPGNVEGWTCGQVRGVPEGICEDCPTAWAIRNRGMERGMVSISRGRKRDFYEVTAFPILRDNGEVEQVLELVQDISEKFKPVEETRRNEEYYRTLFEHSGTAVCVLEPDKTISKVNRRFCQLTGYARNEIEGKKSFLDLVAEPERKRMSNYHERRRINPIGAPSSYEFTFVNKKGEERQANITVGLVPGTMQSICSIRDVTDEEQTKEFLETVLYGSADAIIGLDVGLSIISWNLGAENLFGYRPKEIIGRTIYALWPEESRGKNELERITQILHQRGSVKNFESEMMTRDGETILVNLTMSFLNDKLGKQRGFGVIVRDITEQKALEQQVLHTEKLAAVGQLTAGLAHEMGTPLNVVSGRAEYLLSDFPENDPRRESLQTIIHQTERMTKLIDNLLRFSRPQKPQYTRLDIPEVMEGVLNLLATQLEKGAVHVDFRVAPELPPIEADYNQLQQVFLNLILNSIQAMPDGGQLTADVKPAESGLVRISISDTGVGIASEHLPRIFDPFFTTKEFGKGTGLGLTIVSKILRDHAATVKVESQPDKGTVFSIMMPISQARLEEEPS